MNIVERLKELLSEEELKELAVLLDKMWNTAEENGFYCCVGAGELDKNLKTPSDEEHDLILSLFKYRLI